MPWPSLEVTWQLVLPVPAPLPLRMWVGCVRARPEDCPALSAGPEDRCVLAPGATIHPLSGAELGHPQGSSQTLWPLGAGPLNACPCFPWPLRTRALLVPRPCPPQKQAELRVELGDRADQGSSVWAVSLWGGGLAPALFFPGGSWGTWRKRRAGTEVAGSWGPRAAATTCSPGLHTQRAGGSPLSPELHALGSP